MVYTTAMWSDAGVGIAAQQFIMKYFIDCIGYKFTVAQALISQLAVDSVPPVIGTVQYMDRTLDYWYKDLLEALLTGQIAKEHINQPGFSYTSVDFVIGADHGQGSFLFGKDLKEFLPKTGTLSGQVGTVEIFLGMNAGS